MVAVVTVGYGHVAARWRAMKMVDALGLMPPYWMFRLTISNPDTELK